MHKYLVTGGAGFIGANFVKYLLTNVKACEITVVDSLTYAGCKENLASEIEHNRIQFECFDIRDQERMADLLKIRDIDTVVHFAAESHVDRSIAGPEAFVQTNLVGTHSMLAASRQVWLEGAYPKKAHRFHHISTDEVFGELGSDDAAFTETTPYAPNSPYSASKAGSDFLVRAYHKTYGLDVTMTNCSNNYGPYQFPEKLMPLAIINALLGRKIPVYGDGTNIRDWLQVHDHCRGIHAVLQSGAKGQTYNIGGNCERTNIDIIQLICACVDDASQRCPDFSERYPDCPASQGSSTKSLIEFVTDRPGHDWRYAINANKIENELGFRPAIALESGIRDLVKWMLDNANWWRSKI